MLSAAFIAVALCASPPAAVDTVVVCPLEFRGALEPWLAHRREQGHRLTLLDNRQPPQELRAAIRGIAHGGGLKFVVLVGDADPAMHRSPAVRGRSVPTHYAEAVVNIRYGSTAEIATDNWYADLDDDRVPELAVGRLPCDSPRELTSLVDKILAYERSADFGAWRRRVHFVAGIGGFGPVADAAIEAAAKTSICEGVPAAFSTTMTYGNWQSPYCPDPRDFRRVTLARLNEGSLFWVYIGHGYPDAVDELLVPGARFPILTADDTPQLACRHGAPIACFLSCFSGAYDLPRDCLAEEMLRAPGGPVAVLAGSRVTMPYAMSVLGAEFLHQAFGARPATLGEMFLEGKRRTMHNEQPGAYRAALAAAARLMSPTGDEFQTELAEHLDLFNLLGDPLLRVPLPQAIDLEAPTTIAPGAKLTLAGKAPWAGRAVIEVAVRRDRLTFRPPARRQLDAQTLAGYDETYRRANEPRLRVTEVQLAAGPFATEVEVPAEARGPCQLRLFLEGPTGCAAGGVDVQVEPPATIRQAQNKRDAAGS
jgi:hypothetical protein